jgi:dATP/dGTP pyrophosphohydrolase
MGERKMSFDLVEHIKRQIVFSYETFGPSQRTLGILDHLGKEMTEIAEHPFDLGEWIDVIILGIDGAWRAGYSAEQIAFALMTKQQENEEREWPDWRTVPEDKAIEHIREVPDLNMISGEEWKSMSVDERREAVRRSRQ